MRCTPKACSYWLLDHLVDLEELCGRDVALLVVVGPLSIQHVVLVGVFRTPFAIAEPALPEASSKRSGCLSVDTDVAAFLYSAVAVVG